MTRWTLMALLLAAPALAQGVDRDAPPREERVLVAPGVTLGGAGTTEETVDGRSMTPASPGRLGDRLGGDTALSGTGSSGTTSTIGSGADGAGGATGVAGSATGN